MPIRVALVNDLPAVERHVTTMLETLEDRVEVVPRSDEAEVALFELRPDGHGTLERARALKDKGTVRHVVLLTDVLAPIIVDAARAIGASGVVLTSLGPRALVDALERVVSGERVGLGPQPAPAGLDALTDRELEVLALLGRGLTNQEIGRELFLGVETVRTYVRSILRKLGVANRTQAALRSGRFVD